MILDFINWRIQVTVFIIDTCFWPDIFLWYDVHNFNIQWALSYLEQNIFETNAQICLRI